MGFNPLEQGFFIAQWVKTHWTKDFSEVFSIKYISGRKQKAANSLKFAALVKFCYFC